MNDSSSQPEEKLSGARKENKYTKKAHNHYFNQYRTNEPTMSQDLHTEEVYPLPQALTQNPNESQSPHSQSQQQFKRRSFGISHAENQPSTCSTSYPLLDNSPRMGNFSQHGRKNKPVTAWIEKQNISTDQEPEKASRIRQTAESDTFENQGQHSLSQAIIENNPNKRQSPHSYSQQQCETGSPVVLHAYSQPSTRNTSYTLPGNSPREGNFSRHRRKNKPVKAWIEKQIVSTEQEPENASRTRQIVERDTYETQGPDSLSQVIIQNNPNNRQLPQSPSPQQFQRESCAIPHAENLSSTCIPSYPLPGNSPRMGNFSWYGRKKNVQAWIEKQIVSTDQETKNASRIRQPAESDTFETQGPDSLPQAIIQNNPNNRQLPQSSSTQQFQRGPCAIPHAENQPSTSSTSNTLPGNSPRMGNFSRHGREKKTVQAWIEKQNVSTNQEPDNPSRARQHVESDKYETEGSHSLPQGITENNLNKRHSPHSYSQQQFETGSPEVLHAENEPSASSTLHALSGNSPGMDNSINEQNVSSDQESDNESSIESVDLSMLQHQYSNRSEPINILVYGPRDWTSHLLQTFAGESSWTFASPYSFAFQRNITRCGILMNVSVWQIDDLNKSSKFLRSRASEKSTIMFVLKVKDRLDMFLNITPKVDLIRRDISGSVPLVLVGSKVSTGFSKIGVLRRDSVAFTKTGFRMKARLDLSAFLECSINSTEEVNDVMFTAIDVSLLPKYK